MNKKGGDKNFDILKYYVELLNDELFDVTTMREIQKFENLLLMKSYLNEKVLPKSLTFGYNYYK